VLDLVTILAMPGFCLAAALDWLLKVPVVTAATTWLWNCFGMPSAVRRFTSEAMTTPLTREPSTATPVTAPNSRLVLVIEAAIPECSAGIDDSAEAVTQLRRLRRRLRSYGDAPLWGLLVNLMRSDTEKAHRYPSLHSAEHLQPPIHTQLLLAACSSAQLPTARPLAVIANVTRTDQAA